MKGVAAAVVTAIMIGALYFGREVFVPIALAILLSFVLAPLVRIAAAWHIPRRSIRDRRRSLRVLRASSRLAA